MHAIAVINPNTLTALSFDKDATETTIYSTTEHLFKIQVILLFNYGYYLTYLIQLSLQQLIQSLQTLAFNSILPIFRLNYQSRPQFIACTVAH